MVADRLGVPEWVAAAIWMAALGVSLAWVAWMATLVLSAWRGA